MSKKPKIGYQKKKVRKISKAQRRNYVSDLLISNPRRVSFNEKLIKFFIYIALRLVIPPRKWRDPEKNFEIIDRTYKRIVSSDFIFIPSSIAFYLMIAAMPILSLVMFLFQVDFIQHLLTEGHWSYTIKDSNGHVIAKEVLDLPAWQATHPGSFEIAKDWIIDKNLLSDVLGKFLPGVDGVLQQLIITKKEGTTSLNMGAYVATIISLIASTWIAAGGFSKLVYTQSYLFDHKFVGGYWMNKLKGMIMVATFSLFVILILIANVSVQKGIDSTGWSSLGRDVFMRIFLVIMFFATMFIGFSALYKLSPRFSISFRHILPGAMVTTIPTALFFTILGSISSVWNYGSYGVIGTIMFIGMAALWITYFIFVGISTNVAYYKTFVGQKVKNKWTISKK